MRRVSTYRLAPRFIRFRRYFNSSARRKPNRRRRDSISSIRASRTLSSLRSTKKASSSAKLTTWAWITSVRAYADQHRTPTGARATQPILIRLSTKRGRSEHRGGNPRTSSKADAYARMSSSGSRKPAPTTVEMLSIHLRMKTRCCLKSSSKTGCRPSLKKEFIACLLSDSKERIYISLLRAKSYCRK